MRGLSLTLLIPAALIAFGSHGFAAQPPVADDPLPPPANRKVDFAKDIKPLLLKHCISCHGPKKEKGDLRLDQLSRDFKSGLDGQIWAEVVEKINAGEMPAEDEPQPANVPSLT